jgi:hypothetical protein
MPPESFIHERNDFVALSLPRKLVGHDTVIHTRRPAALGRPPCTIVHSEGRSLLSRRNRISKCR